MMNAGGSNAALRQDIEFEHEEVDSNVYPANDATNPKLEDQATEFESEFGELDELTNEVPIVSKSIDEVQKEIMDEHDGWMFESTITDFSAIDLSNADCKDVKEPAWRVLERLREEKELRASLDEDLFLAE